MNRLKELREEKKLSQTEIANDLKTSQQQWSRWEKEEIRLSYDGLIKVSNYFNTSIDYILYKTDERKPYPKSKEKSE